MDPRIEALRSTTFFGRRLTRQQISEIQTTVAAFPLLSRHELGQTICEQLGWRTGTGTNRIQLCQRLLEELERLGLLVLPAKDASYARGPRKPIEKSQRTEKQPAIAEPLGELLLLQLRLVEDEDEVSEWNEFVDRWHYAGFRHPLGPRLRYFVEDRHGRKLGCLQFSQAVVSLPCRDAWIGWPEEGRKAHLERVVGNTRFLLFPWVEVRNLASKVLSMAVRRLADDWEHQHGCRPVLVETFVDSSRFDGACYRAANWLDLGETRGGKGKAPKRVYVYPLAADFREVLLHGPQRTAPRRKATPRVAPALAADDPFLLAWQELVGAATAAATAHDRVWKLRRRVINTLLVVLFVYRLMFSGNGYTATLAALWQQCQACGIPLPQAEPVAASSMSAARAKVDEAIFKSLHAEILKRAGSSQWKGHRVFAVDGSKINLPRPLLRAGYRLPQERAHYPQGLLSCLYELAPKLPIDFDLHAHGDERAAALAHLPALAVGDVVVYDRGYYSYRMLLAHAQRGVHPLFRLQRNAGTAFDDFVAGSEQDELTTITPGPDTLRRPGRKDPEAEPRPIPLRLVKYVHGGTEFHLATTLLDRSRYPVQNLADLYHDRWGIEELYKTSKLGFELENFHSRSERGVKQEIFAHFNLIAMTRLFTNFGDAMHNSQSPPDPLPESQANFKAALFAVARNLEGLILRHAAMMHNAVRQVLACVETARQRLRPNRTYPRRSRKPLGKGQKGRDSAAAA